jgi:hypothetical protein
MMAFEDATVTLGVGCSVTERQEAVLVTEEGEKDSGRKRKRLLGATCARLFWDSGDRVLSHASPSRTITTW